MVLKKKQKILKHVDEINKCNQRGGRMLSVIDLINAGTMNKEMAAYFLVALSKGKSFLVGSKPGGSGKTTVMGALLNLIPDVDIVPVDSKQVLMDGLTDKEKKCYLAHEIGYGGYYAYISGEDTRDFLKLVNNHMVVSNLHADDINEVLDHEGIDKRNLTKIDLLLFLRIAGNIALKKRIGTVYENQDGEDPRMAFKPVFRWNGKTDSFYEVNNSKFVNEKEIKEATKIIDEMMDRNLKTIEEVRAFIQRTRKI